MNSFFLPHLLMSALHRWNPFWGFWGVLDWIIPSQDIPGFQECAQADRATNLICLSREGPAGKAFPQKFSFFSQKPSRKGEIQGEKRGSSASDNSTKPPAGNLLSEIKLGLKVNQLAQLQVKNWEKNIQIALGWSVGLFILNSPGQRKISKLPAPFKIIQSWEFLPCLGYINSISLNSTS